MTKYFKALIPFSSYEGIFNVGDTTPGKAPKEKVDAWVKAGYVVEVEAPNESDLVKAPVNEFELNEMQTVDEQEQKFIEVTTFGDKEPQFLPIDEKGNLEPAQDVLTNEQALTLEDAQEAKNEPQANEIVQYESMTYPQLKKAAKAANIKGYNTMKQVELVKALQKGG